MRRCPRCETDRSLDEYGRRGDGRPVAYCKPCRNAYAREWNKKNPGRAAAAQRKWAAENPEAARRSKKNQNLGRYGITLAQYEEMFVAQGHACALCGSLTATGNGFSVDHDHSCCPEQLKSCGKCVRGILCAHCNQGLGQFRDDIDHLEKAIAYLKRTTQLKTA